MKTLLKVIIILFTLAVALVLTAAAAISLLLDPNDFKDEIAAQVQRYTGRQLTLMGDLKLSVFPWLGIETGALSLGNAPGFGAEPFLTSNKAQLRVRLLPLLNKKVEMDTLSLEGMTLNLVRNRQGKTNWEDLISKEKGSETKPLPVAAFALGGIQIVGAAINWNDQPKGERYTVQDLSLKTSAFTPGKSTKLALSFTVASSTAGVASEVAIQGTAAFDLKAQHYQLAPLSLNARFKGKPISGGEADLRLTAAIDADLKNQTLRLTGITLSVLGAEAKGEVQGKNILGETPSFDGTLAIEAKDPSTFLLKSVGQGSLASMVKALSAETRFSGSLRKVSLNPLHIKATLASAQIPKGPANLTLETQAEANLEEQTLALNQLAIQGLGLGITGTAQVKEIFKSPQYQGTVAIAPFNPRDLLVQLGQKAPLTADPKVLTNMGANAVFAGAQSRLNLSAMTLQLDDTQIKGYLSVADLTQPAIQFELVVDAMDADRYLLPQGEGDKPVVATPGAAAGAAARLPVDTLRAINAQGDLTIGQLKVANARLSHLNLHLDAEHGDIKLSPVTADLYQGKYRGDIGLDVRGDPPKLTLNESFTGIQAEPLLTDLTGKAKLSGVGDFKAELSASGGDAQAIKRTITGTGGFAFRDGAYKGINLGLLIRKAKAGFVAPVEKQVQTDFTELKGSWKVDQGVVSNHDLIAKSPLLRVQGNGTANLVSEAIDYTLNTTIVETSKGQGGKELEELKGITVPIRISGTFDDPKYTPDLTAIAKAKAQKELEQQKQKLKTKVEEKLKEEIGQESAEKLKELLKF